MDVGRHTLKIIRIVPVIVLALCLILANTTAVFAADPTVTTDAASSVQDDGAILNGTLTSLGTFTGTVYLSFDYASDDYYTTHGSTYNKHTADQGWLVVDGVTTFAATITNLTAGSNYHFRARVRFGSTYAYGADDDFDTTMADPDVIPRLTVKAYKDLIETDDCLFVIYANIPYTTIPQIPVNEAFTWSLMQSGVPVGSNTGYAMHNNGYGYNVYSLYFTAADNIDWGNNVDYSLQLSGNPETFTTPPVYDTSDSTDYLVNSSVWVASTDYHETLKDDLLYIAKRLEQNWQVVLMDEQDTKTVLSSNGEKLFRNAITGVQSMAPGLFFVQSATADTGKRTWGTSLGDTYKARLAGADGVFGTADDNWIAGSIEGLADWINVPFLLIIGALCLGVCVFVIYKSNQKFGTSMPGYMASFIVVICFTMMALGFTVLALIALALVIGAGWLLFMRRA